MSDAYRWARVYSILLVPTVCGHEPFNWFHPITVHFFSLVTFE